MPGTTFNGSGKVYLKIIGGKIVQHAQKGDPGAVLREYELPNGEKGSKWEIPYSNWEAKIKGITFKDTDFGEVCNVELDDALLQLNTTSRYFQDFACKLPNGDLMKPFVFHPYDMEGEGGKKIVGISLKQDGEKLKNYYYNPETKESLNGFPEVDQEKKVKKTYWKIYFAEVAEFLIDELKALAFPKSQTEVAEQAFSEDEIKDLPF